ncbi:hypothetical protein CORC01_10076 [Colletotrichum orchidophilum]|uniref:Uncharacterized protein n=1 Tax=Colletotrichum orchidophilum TaxID=1209926 RepID=A0A1G4B007_9PEZI|nr:uncharacterized protein CORC01_10076 [Colletotrichum orchidophilum]OHE94675.1 hypothetical protein CORC01_10076 [Colletotrichum orchidophilum]
MQQTINGNASYLYPYIPEEWIIEQQSNLNFTPFDFISPLDMTFDEALTVFLLAAGNITSNCTLTASWYHSHNLQSGGHGNLSSESPSDAQDMAFMHLAAPELVDAYSSWVDRILENPSGMTGSMVIYTALANTTASGGDAVLNVTRPAIELHCLSRQLADTYTWETQDNCTAELNRWLPPGFEEIDALFNIRAAFAALPEQYQDISIQTFWGWYNLQNVLTAGEIYTRKKQCYQTVCSDLQNSGNPDIAGVGMFVSYIIEAILATFIILQTCWHNWKHREIPLENTSDIKTQPNFVGVANAFLNTGIVLLLSLAVALLAVGSRETIFYNGIVTQMACFFAASAVIAVASVPRRGCSRSPIFWIILLFSTLMSTISMNLAGQLNTEFGDPLHALSDTSPDYLDIMLYPLLIPHLNYSIGASEFLSVQKAMGAYYTEAALGYGQVLSLFMWAPVFGMLLQLGAKRLPKTVKDRYSDLPKLPIWYHTEKAPPIYAAQSQNSIPLLEIPTPRTSPRPGSVAHSSEVPPLDQLPPLDSSDASRFKVYRGDGLRISTF